MAYFREITEHYRIEKPLGTRADGGVYRAADPVTGAPVTLKLLPLADAPPESAQDFVRAMGILQALRHPSLPTLFDFGFTPNGHAFLVLEYVDGRGAEALQGGSPAQILPLLGQVLDGLERLHKEGISHLNLCPENLLVVPGPAPGRIQMVGLGTAPLRAPGERPEREAAGYAAPELGRPQDLGKDAWRADLFSLALVACRLLEARLEESGKEPQALAVTLPLGVSFELEDDQVLQEVLERSLRHRPEERPGFAEIRQAFARALAGPAGPRTLPESRIFLSPEPEGDPWPPLPRPKAAPPVRDTLEDTNPVFRPELVPPPATPAMLAMPETPAAMQAPLGTAGEPVRAETLVVPPPPAVPEPTIPELAMPAPLLFPDPTVFPDPIVFPDPVDLERAPETAPELPVAVLLPEAVLAAPPLARTPPPARPPRRYLLWAGVAAAALGVGFFVLRSRPNIPTGTASGPAARVPASLPPAAPAARSAAPPLPAKLAAASDAYAEGKDDMARQALAALTPDEEAAFTPEACNVYGVLRSSLDAADGSNAANAGDASNSANAANAAGIPDLAARARRVTDLRTALKGGDLVPLVVALKAIPTQERSALQAEPGLRKELAAAKRGVDLYQRYQKAARAGEPVELLAAAGAVTAAFPRFKEAAERREKIATGLEGEAETLAQTGALDGAVERLETLHRGWPERPGLADRLARYSAELRSEQAMAAVLSKVAAAESRKRPDEGLALLEGAKPTPRYEARFGEAQKRLEAQLAQLDSHPPVVQLAATAAALEFEKGAAAHIPLKITDDFQVKTVTVHVRPEGGAWTELPCNRAGTDCTVEVPEALHQNRTVELYAVATDLSGHKGQLGSPEKPQQIRRKHWYDRLRGKG